MARRRQAWTWKNVFLDKRVEEELGRHFRLDIYQAFLENEPDDVEVLMEVGNLYTLSGDVENGLAIDQKLVQIRPGEPIFHYNLACSHSLLNDVDAALRALELAVELGYSNLEYLQEDSDLENVRSDERFQRIVDGLRKKRKRSASEEKSSPP